MANATDPTTMPATAPPEIFFEDFLWAKPTLPCEDPEIEKILCSEEKMRLAIVDDNKHSHLHVQKRDEAGTK